MISNKKHKTFFLSWLFFLPLLMLSGCNNSNVSSPASSEPTERSTNTVLFENLDERDGWKEYLEGSPEWEIGNRSAPSLDGKVLLCAIKGGVPYSNLHCYLNLPSEPTASIFILTLSFWLPLTTCNNQETDSLIQALEFTMNKWYQSKRYEFALQWQNVGSGAPQWRYWDPNKIEKWIAMTPPITECLAGEKWHTLTISGSIRENNVYYERFEIDHRFHEIGISVDPAAVSGEEDKLAVAIQLDGNAYQTPYSIYIDHVVLTAQSLKP